MIALIKYTISIKERDKQTISVRDFITICWVLGEMGT